MFIKQCPPPSSLPSPDTYPGSETIYTCIIGHVYLIDFPSYPLLNTNIMCHPRAFGRRLNFFLRLPGGFQENPSVLGFPILERCLVIDQIHLQRCQSVHVFRMKPCSPFILLPLLQF